MNCKALLNIAIEIALYKYCIIIIIIVLGSGIFKKVRTFFVVPDVLSKFSKIGNVFFFR